MNSDIINIYKLWIFAKYNKDILTYGFMNRKNGCFKTNLQPGFVLKGKLRYINCSA